MAAAMTKEPLQGVRVLDLAAVVAGPLDRLVLELTDAMTRDIEVPDSLFERVRELFDAEQLVDLVATIAAYNMVSRFLVALRIER